MWGRIIIGAILMVVLAAALIFTAGGWARAEGIEMSIIGIVALVLGGVLTFALGAGLMALVYYSARKGFDDGVQDYTKPGTRPDKDEPKP
jgi:nitrate reductase gamma subunit